MKLHCYWNISHSYRFNILKSF